ncbi:serine/threonine protein kinase PkaE [Kribbella sancticallisti]|uniref:non-specific serine/threonine protein kinase n=1 Tax=Kribbella sancticallisti TaxID=460087 RepID=A0ABP4N2V0_9ACTN
MPEQARVIAGRYELAAPISRGGMGEVWRGYDTVLDRDIAVKLIRPQLLMVDEEREELVGRFRREARVMAKVEHPGVPAVYDAAFDDGSNQLFIVMQLIHGPSLSDVLAEETRLVPSWAASVAAQICSVLSYAHAVPVVHRDLKPGNIMLARGGVVKVLDFGIAALLRSDVTKLTSTGRVMGTKPYMSPEQIQNLPVTPQTDLYALGCLLHEMLSGQRVFDATEEIALMYQHLEKPPTPLRELEAGIPADLERLVLDLLAKNASDRPESAWAAYDRLVPLLPPADSLASDTEQPAGVIPDPTRPFRRPAAPRPRPSMLTRDVAALPAIPEIDLDEVDEALSEAERLVDEERFTQASEMLCDLLPRASASFGSDSEQALDLRISYAAALYLGGDYRKAAPEFEALAKTYTLDGNDTEESLDYRRQAVACRVALGELDAAIPELESIVRAQHRIDAYGRDYLSLRLDLARLRVSAGDPEQAVQELWPLYEDAVRILTPSDELSVEIDEMFRRLRATRGR